MRCDNIFHCLLLTGPFPAKAIYKVAVGVAKALSYLHNTSKYLHGDIKSANILVGGDFETVKLCDFGVAMKLKSLDELLVSRLAYRYIGHHIAGQVYHQLYFVSSRERP